MSFPILSLILSCNAAEPPPVEVEPVQIVQGIDIDGVAAMLTAKSDKIRVFNFWATWCGPCVSELPMLRDFAAEHDEVDIILISLDMHSVRAKRVIPYIAKYELTELTNYQLEDRDPSVAMEKIPGWPGSIPVTLFVTKDGRNAKQFNTAMSKEQLTAALITL